MADVIDAYKVLQVDPEAEDDVIQAAYRRLARKYHPDLAAGTDADGRMAAINAAWALVGTRTARAAYDRARAASTSDRHGPRFTGTHAGGAPRAQPAPPGQGAAAAPPRSPETVSRDWTSGRSTVGGGFDPSMRQAEGLGAAGPPPGRPSGRVLNFGRYGGWSLGEIARRDLEYLEWLDRMPIGRIYRDELDAILRAAGRRQSSTTDSTERRGLFRRR
jgi:curved DNA-binding protein CbpA